MTHLFNLNGVHGGKKCSKIIKSVVEAIIPRSLLSTYTWTGRTKSTAAKKNMLSWQCLPIWTCKTWFTISLRFTMWITPIGNAFMILNIMNFYIHFHLIHHFSLDTKFTWHVLVFRFYRSIDQTQNATQQNRTQPPQALVNVRTHQSLQQQQNLRVNLNKKFKISVPAGHFERSI